VDWNVAILPGQRRILPEGDFDRRIERCNAKVCAKVEHLFRYVKRLFCYETIRYRGLANRTNRLALLLGFSYLMTAERYPASAHWVRRSAFGGRPLNDAAGRDQP
jgi:IS5 family transposase